jgi:hypothetical protein
MDKLSIDKAMSQDLLIHHLDSIDTAIKNQCFAAVGMCIGSSAPEKVKIANTVVFTSGGVFKSKSTAEIAFTANTHDIAASASAVQEAIYLVTLAADGTPTLTMGTIASGTGNAKFPDRPATGTPIGAARIAIAAGATKFDASSDALSAGHITDSYYDLGYYAPRFDAAI